MTTTWSGFSEDDIKKLKTGKSPTEVDGIRRKIKAKRRTDLQQNVITKTSQIHKITDGIYDIPEDAKLSNNEQENDNTSQVLSTPVDSPPVNKTAEGNSITLNMTKIEKRVIDLDEFQARQKLIEEQNRRRKELLAKALADRTKQTEEEARRLKEIQDEFKKLDALLSNDVAILRHQIEIASLDFMEAQKRYHKVEKEFLDAKLVLHQKLEKKEMLTEHLCAIIEKNEERKAEKLNELMSRLTVGGKSVSDAFKNENSVENSLDKTKEILNENTSSESASNKSESDDTVVCTNGDSNK